jgi:hypothetical protein
MPDQQAQVCPVCKVRIVKAPGGDKVLFSSGPPGTRSRLSARVCQFVKKNGCINKDPNLIGDIKSEDYYKPEL